MIAPEGIRDGRYFAEALYTFAGEGVEDLPFSKGDLIEVLDCADANWWRGKIHGTDEDGLFPACLVRFTDASATEKAMKTAERLAHLSDVLTPSYAKGHAESSNQPAGGASDDNSIESLLLNLANNEMQVQQQKVQAHMPRKPTRMKLLYEDHTHLGDSGRASQMSTFSDVPPKQPASRPPLPTSLPMVPQQKQPRPRQKDDRPSSQAGLWSPARSNTQQALSSCDGSLNSSLESMREAAARAEESSRLQNSGSMLFGPRGMPPASSSRASSRAQDGPAASSVGSQLYLPSCDRYSQAGAQTSFTSLYSLSDAASTIASGSRAAHEAAIAEARQMLDGIPSPTEQGIYAHHEADYLFGDSDNDEAEGPVDNKLQSMISPASDTSARFASRTSTVSSHASSAAGSSRRLPTIVSTADNSMVSDTSSLGLAGQSSIGDLTVLHRSWYSSTDSLNLAGGGVLGSPRATGFGDDDGDSADAFAPRMVKTKSRIRPAPGASVQPEAGSSSACATPMPASHPAENQQDYDELASDFQRMAAISASASIHNGSTTPPCSSQQDQPQPQPQPQPHLQHQHQHQMQQQHHYQHQQHQQLYSMGAMTMQPDHGGYYAHNGYAVPAPYEFANTVQQQPMNSPMAYGGYDASGQPYPTTQPTQQVFYDQQRAVSAASMVSAIPPHEQVQANYHDPPFSAMTYQQQQQQQQQQQHAVPPISTGRPMSVVSAAMTNGPGRLAAANSPLPVDASAAGRPRSYTAGSLASNQPNGGTAVRTPTIMPGQAGKGIPIPARPQQMPAASPLSQRPASFDGTSSVSGSVASNTLKSTAAPEFGGSFRSGGSALGSIASGGFGTMSSTPPATFAQREGRMSPFPSNVGPSRPGTVASTVGNGAAKDAYVEEIDPQLKQPLPPNVTPINYVKMTRPVFKYGGHISHPEATSWSRIDRQMTMLKVVSVKLTIDILATMHVGRPFNKPIERVRAAFIWIASNIQYDMSVAESNDEFEKHEAPEAVLQRRRSRGPGFAYLFDAMMSALGIESHTVRGYLRQPLDMCQGAVLPAANHVWNVVCLDGEFRLIDTACAARSHPLNAESNTDAWFFLASPKDVIFTHFPLTPADQFVDPVVPLPVFWMLPYVRPNYFQSKVKLLNLPLVPRIELKDDAVTPLVLCVRDLTLSVFAEVELHDPNGSGRIVARQPLLAQCMDYQGKRMVKILVGVRGGDVHGLVKIYCGMRLPLQPKRAGDAAASPTTAKKVLGFLHGKDRRPSAHDYSRIKDVDEEGAIRTVATSRTFPLACILPVRHKGRNNAPVFVQPNAALPNEFYIKEPTAAQLHLGESIVFHLLPVGEERLFHMQLRSPSGQQHKFVYQPSDQGYILRHTVKERGAWIIIFHSDSEGWLPIASYTCI